MTVETETGGNSASPNSASTVERAADVLLLFADSSSAQLGVTEIANTLGMSKSAVHRILLSFKNKRLLELDPQTKKYALGPTILGLGARYLGRLDIRTFAAPELTRLSRATDETATLSIRSGADRRVYVDQVTPDREVLMSVQLGVAHPLHAGGSSKSLLAFLPQVEIDQYLSGSLDKVTSKTVTNVRTLRKELNLIRERGWAQSSGERQLGSASVAAPILNRDGYPLAVVSVCGPAERFAGEVEGCVRELLASTRALSVRMGHQPPAG
ncbi:IclR family transcriptional regulator [Actinoplanes sp. NPDC051411]|uniref:IclR family transcriptional regulator n=1 Tax=Actinoplanes sp. NPDC051411 TaxID=3155522 RepID=UPI00341B1EA5